MKALSKQDQSRSILNKITDVYLFLLLSLFILICGPYEYIVFIKYFLFLLICGGYVAIISVILLYLLLFGDRRHFFANSNNNIFLFSIFFYILFTFLSALRSPYEYNYWIGMSRYEGLLTQILYMMSMVYVSIFGHLRKKHIFVFGITMVLFCIISLIQLNGANPFLLYPSGYNYFDGDIAYSGHYLGTIGNADLVSALLSMACAVFGTAIVLCKDKKALYLIIPLSLCLIVLARMAVAAGLVSVLLTYLVLIPIYFYILKRAYWRKILAIVLIVLLVIAGLLYCIDFQDFETLHQAHLMMHGIINDSFGSSRIYIWKAVISKIPEHLFFGTGPDSMMAWNLPGFSKYVDFLDIVVYRGIDVAHNELLNVFAQQGMLAAIAYLCIVVSVIGLFFNSHDKISVCIPFSAVLAYLIQAMFCFSMCIVAPVFYIFMGLLNDEEDNRL